MSWDPDLHYVLADVFTETAFGGNALAVFPQAAGLTEEIMQAVARELALSETVFCMPAAHPEASLRLRIFTPTMELPFAGHPTIGAALVLTDGATFSDGSGLDLVLEEEAGLVQVRVESRSGLRTATLVSPQFPLRMPSAIGPAEAAALIDVDERALGPWAVCVFSAGVPFHFIPVKDAATLRSAALDIGVWRTHLAGSAAPHVYVYSLDDWAEGRTVNARMFAPAMGIAEDPATGGAAAALAGLLIDQMPTDEGGEWTITQGVEINRPSTLLLQIDPANAQPRHVRVSGSAVIIGSGELRSDAIALAFRGQEPR